MYDDLDLDLDLLYLIGSQHIDKPYFTLADLELAYLLT